MLIKSLLDTDLYKFTMQQVVYHNPSFLCTEVEYTFKCRNYSLHKLVSPACVYEIRKEINNLACLKLRWDELEYLGTLKYFQPNYLKFLETFRLHPKKYVSLISNNNEFKLKIKGPWIDTILFEVPILAIINEVYYRHTAHSMMRGIVLLEKKVRDIKANTATSNFKFVDFGTRRRHSFDWQERVIKTLKEEVPKQFIGTSNVYFAKKYNLTPTGTMAHEFIQAGQGGYGIRDSQMAMLRTWMYEYKGQLGIALTDTLGLKKFLRDFDFILARVYDGVRQDSGDPYDWCEKILEHYKKLGIDPKTKTAVFSDGLTFPDAFGLYTMFRDRIKMVFGIGTNLTNAFGNRALQNVIKMTRFGSQAVAKLSDSLGKQTCEDKKYLKKLKEELKHDDNQYHQKL